MKHIIIVGDSFSDVNLRSEIYDYNFVNLKNITSLITGGSIKPATQICLDVIDQKKQKDILIHTVAKGSAGNHYISDKLYEKVQQIKNNNISDEIYAIIQLTAFFRNDQNLKSNIKHIDVEKYKYDYYNFDSELSFSELKQNYLKHLENIENIHNFCESNGINKIMFFGWSTIYDQDLLTFKISDKVKQIENFVTFFPYEKSLDEMESYCAGLKHVQLLDNNSKLYYVGPNKYGGMTDFIRNYVPIGERYIMSYDAHLTSKSNVIFYDKVIKPWLISVGLIHDLKLSEERHKVYELLFSIEKLKYEIFFGTDRSDYDQIQNLIRSLLENSVSNINLYKQSFEDLRYKMTT